MRTSHKAFIPQLAATEHRQAWIRRIRMQREKVSLADPSPEVLEQHHVIGKSQNFPEDINIFLWRNSEDPAAKVILLFHGYVKLIEQICIGLPTEPQGPHVRTCDTRLTWNMHMPHRCPEM